MADDSLVELTDSVFRETPLEEAEFDDRRIPFDSKADADTWVTGRNREHAGMGRLTGHTAYPADASAVHAYVVFRPANGVRVPDS